VSRVILRDFPCASQLSKALVSGRFCEVNTGLDIGCVCFHTKYEWKGISSQKSSSSGA